MAFRVVHISDTHGDFPQLGDGDIVVHSGDLLPNGVGKAYFGGIDANLEKNFQHEWVRRKIEKFCGWLKNRPFVLSRGNHDYFDPTELLRRAGIDAYDCTEKPVSVLGRTFVGFPFVPIDCHPWNYATDSNRMSMRFDDLASDWEAAGGFDFLVPHCPPAGIFDRCPLQNKRFGNAALNDFLTYKITKQPRAVFCGHIHGDNGVTLLGSTLLSQAATRVQYVEFQED